MALSRSQLQKRIRDLQEDKDHLQTCLWLALGGEEDETIEIIPFEKIGKTKNDTFLKNLFTYSE